MNSGKKLAEIAAKDGVKNCAKIAGLIMSYVMVAVFASILTSKWKDNVYKEYLKKHDKQTAEKLTKQFKSEVDALKKDIAKLKQEKEQAKKQFRDRIIVLCKKYGVSPDLVLK